jgi:hypothetical protein
MKTTIYNLLFAVVFFGFLHTSCSKTEITAMTPVPNVAATDVTADAGKPSPGTASILNQHLNISYARENGVDITDQFNDFTFIFEGTYPSGNAHVWNCLLAQTGTWSSPSDITDFVLSYPTGIFSQLAFLNREWNIDEATTNFYKLTAANGNVVNFVSEKVTK